MAQVSITGFILQCQNNSPLLACIANCPDNLLCRPVLPTSKQSILSGCIPDTYFCRLYFGWPNNLHLVGLYSSVRTICIVVGVYFTRLEQCTLSACIPKCQNSLHRVGLCSAMTDLATMSERIPVKTTTHLVSLYSTRQQSLLLSCSLYSRPSAQSVSSAPVSEHSTV